MLVSREKGGKEREKPNRGFSICGRFIAFFLCFCFMLFGFWFFYLFNYSTVGAYFILRFLALHLSHSSSTSRFSLFLSLCLFLIMITREEGLGWCLCRLNYTHR